MSRIYIHEIPNAGGVAEAVLTRSSSQRINLGAAAANLLTPTIEQGAFDGAAKGLNAIGKGLGDLGAAGAKVSAVLADWQERKQEAKDRSALNKAELAYNTSIQGLPDRIAQRPNDDPAKFLRDYSVEMDKLTSGFGISEKSSPELQALRSRSLNTVASIVTGVKGQVFAHDVKRSTFSLVDQYIDHGDTDSARDVLQRDLKHGAYTKPQGENYLQQQILGKQRKDANAELGSSPFTLLDEMQQAEVAGRSERYSLLNQQELANLKIKAEAAAVNKTREVSDNLDTEILSGRLVDDQAIREAAKTGRLNETEIASLQRSRREVPRTTPAEQAEYLKANTQLTTALENYDPALDTDDAGYYALKDTIRGKLPQAERGRWLDQLKKRRTEGATSASLLKGNIYKRVDMITSRNSSIEEPSRQMANWQRASSIKKSFSDWLQKKPDATGKEIEGWVTDKLGGEIVVKAARSTKGR